MKRYAWLLLGVTVLAAVSAGSYLASPKIVPDTSSGGSVLASPTIQVEDSCGTVASTTAQPTPGTSTCESCTVGNDHSCKHCCPAGWTYGCVAGHCVCGEP